ncbi:glycosyltransferase [Nanoarchaeota archaeon]
MTEDKPLVSVVIPAYNEEKYIAETIKAIRDLKYENIEIIVSCNSCTDNTVKIAEKLADTVLDTPVKGVSNAKNRGAIAAKGEIIIFLDSDTRMNDDLVKKVVDAYHKGYEGGKPNIRPLDDNRTRAHAACKVHEVISKTTKKWKFFDSAWGCFIFITKKLFNKIDAIYGEGFRTDLSVHEDGDFCKKIKKHGRYVFMTDTYVMTSMRRFKEEGYMKCYLEDWYHFFSPVGKSRKRWDIHVQRLRAAKAAKKRKIL